MTHRDEPELVERVRQYVADGGDLNVRDKTGWGYLNVRSTPRHYDTHTTRHMTPDTRQGC